MVLHPMKRPTRKSNQKPPVTFFLFLDLSLRFSDLSSSCYIQRNRSVPFLSSWRVRRQLGQHMLNNLRGTSGLKLYRELYHTCAYILVYVDTSLLLGPPVHSRLLAGRNWPILAIHTAIHVHPDRT